ncbi:Single-stranded DNA-binding protein, mitochondrial [Linum grandiflorum]
MAATSIATISRRLSRSILSNHNIPHASVLFCTTTASSPEIEPDSLNPDADPTPSSSSSATDSPPSAPPPNSGERVVYDRPLEDGLDIGVYKAILVGQVGQSPFQKKLKGGRTVTLLSVGTGGIRNNRRPLDNEEPRDYANRCAIQWHRVSVYPERLGDLVMKEVVPGSNVYLEGNLETKIFTDPVTGLVRRVREIAIRGNGRLVSLGGNVDSPGASGLKGVGYY